MFVRTVFPVAITALAFAASVSGHHSDAGLDMDSVVSLHQLVSNAIVLDGQAEAAAGTEEETEETAAAGQAGP